MLQQVLVYNLYWLANRCQHVIITDLCSCVYSGCLCCSNFYSTISTGKETGVNMSLSLIFVPVFPVVVCVAASFSLQSLLASKQVSTCHYH